MFTFLISLCGFCLLDKLLTKINLNGIYYLVHAIHNGMIVYSTADEVIDTFLHFKQLQIFRSNMFAIEICFALHIYHILMYFKKLVFEDWLHHILMIGVALPLSLYLPASTLVGFSLFFMTGLPGGIDYLLLFLVRNDIIHRLTEKKINSWLNVYIRSPGCVSCATFIVAYTFENYYYNESIDIMKVYASLLTGFLTYWNGQYFMNRVISDYAIKKNEVIQMEERRMNRPMLVIP